MPHLALRPGYWFRTGNAIICSPQEYVQQEVVALLHRAWVRKPPAAPRGDQLVAPASQDGTLALIGTAPDSAYDVARRANGALRSMDAIVRAAENVTWHGRDSARQYQQPFLGPPVELADRQPRRYWVMRYLDIGGLSDSALGLHCLAIGRDPRAQEAVRSFVRDYGPLIVDFGGWCCDTAYGAPVYAVQVDEEAEPFGYHLGQERLLWPRKWRLWGRGVRTAFEAEYPVWPWVPPPVGFYVWAAYMLTALRDDPAEHACQAFLANRLASLRIASEPTSQSRATTSIEVVAPDGTVLSVLPGGPPAEDDEGPRLARHPSVYLRGELLDYLAVAAAFGRAAALAGEHRMMTCENCGAQFLTLDGRRRYCEACSKPKVRDAARAKRYRQRHPR